MRLKKRVAVVFCLFVAFSSYSMHRRESLLARNPRGQIIRMVSNPAVGGLTLNDLGVSDGHLHMLAFDVGQANFVVLVKYVNCEDGSILRHLAIVDAGFGLGVPDSSLYKGKMVELFEGDNTVLDAVFITHPHKDRYNAFESGPIHTILKRLVQKSAQLREERVPFYLGGTEADWGKQTCSEFVNIIEQGGFPVYMNSDGHGPGEFLGGVFFQILPVIKPVSGGNKLSQPILVWEQEDNKILFTGDAESDSLDRLQGNSYNLLAL